MTQLIDQIATLLEELPKEELFKIVVLIADYAGHEGFLEGAYAEDIAPYVIEFFLKQHNSDSLKDEASLILAQLFPLLPSSIRFKTVTIQLDCIYSAVVFAAGYLQETEELPFELYRRIVDLIEALISE